MGWVGERPTHVPQNPHSPIPLKPQHGWWIEISRSRPCVHSNGQQQYICVNIACIWGIWDKLQYLFWRWCWQKYGGLSLVEITITGGKPWEGIQLQKRDPRSGCNHTCNRSSSGRGRWELQGTNLSEMKAPGVRDLDFHQWHLSKINVCLRVAPHLLLVGTFYLGQLNILSIMHWRIRGQHCEIPPDNHHQVPWSY